MNKIKNNRNKIQNKNPTTLNKNIKHDLITDTRKYFEMQIHTRKNTYTIFSSYIHSKHFLSNFVRLIIGRFIFSANPLLLRILCISQNYLNFIQIPDHILEKFLSKLSPQSQNFLFNRISPKEKDISFIRKDFFLENHQGYRSEKFSYNQFKKFNFGHFLKMRYSRIPSWEVHHLAPRISGYLYFFKAIQKYPKNSHVI